MVGVINKWNTEIFRAVKILCMIPQGWIHIILYLSKPIEYTTRVNSNHQNFGDYDVSM